VPNTNLKGPTLQVCLTHTKTPPPGSYSSPVPRVQGGSKGVGVFLWARYPCTDQNQHGNMVDHAFMDPSLERAMASDR
jgi:hypothetical protein